MQKPISKRLKIFTAVLLVAVAVFAVLAAAIRKEPAATPIVCPFTELGWNTTEQELFAAEGDYTSSYDSTYGGLTYTYNKSYLGRDGVVKYMFDEAGVLMSIAWTCSPADTEELSDLYQEISAGVQELYGESEYRTENPTNYGDVWRSEEGNVILSAMTLESNTVLQVAYVNPAEE